MKLVKSKNGIVHVQTESYQVHFMKTPRWFMACGVELGEYLELSDKKVHIAKVCSKCSMKIRNIYNTLNSKELDWINDKIVGKQKRQKIKVEKLNMSSKDLKRAREKAYEEFKKLVPWKDRV